MYKLLVTTALVAMTATSASANEWTGGKALVQDLETIYQSLEGQTQFDNLQGATGELNTFFSNVDQGVTYVTLTVDPSTHNITAGINPGVAFQTILDSKDDLVNRVNYDLFADDSHKDLADQVNPTYDTDTDYTGIKTPGLGLGGEPENADTETNKYTANHDSGLAGRKIDGLVTAVNTVNDFLINPTTTAADNTAFKAEFDAKTGSTAGVDVADIFTDIDDLNTAINAASTPDGAFFGDIDGVNFDQDAVNNFVIPSYNAHNDIGKEATRPGGYNSISDWANGVQTVEVGTETGTLNSAGTVTIVDETAGTISVDLEGVITTYTLNTTTGVFE